MKRWMKLFSLLALVAGLGYGSLALAAGDVTVTAATGGTAISVDTNATTGSGLYTVLIGPAIRENNPGGITSKGTIILNLAALSGFEFNTGANVTATVTGVPGKSCTGNTATLLGTTPGSNVQVVTPTVNSITITVFRISSGSNQCVVTFSNIQVRPTAASPLANTTITRSGSAAYTVNPALTVDGYGRLTEIAGATKLAFVQQPTNTVAGATITPAVTVAVQNVSGSTVTTNTSTVTLAIGTNPAGGALSGTLSVAAVAGVATFGNLLINNAGTGYTLTASDGALTGATSTAFNITKNSQSITVTTPAPASASYNSQFTVAATASSGLAITYSSGSTGVCTNSGATFTMVAGTGTCIVQYDQAGDSNYNAAVQVQQPVTVAAAFGAFNACDDAADPNTFCTSTTTSTTSRITTKIAGSAFTLDLVALKSDGSWNASYSNNVIVELLDSSNNRTHFFKKSDDLDIGGPNHPLR